MTKSTAHFSGKFQMPAFSWTASIADGGLGLAVSVVDLVQPERMRLMKSRFLPSVVVAVAALTSMGASAQLLNQWLFDQMNASSTQTRVKVKAEVSQPQQAAKAQPKPDSAAAEKADSTGRVNAEMVQTKQP